MNRVLFNLCNKSATRHVNNSCQHQTIELNVARFLSSKSLDTNNSSVKLNTSSTNTSISRSSTSFTHESWSNILNKAEKVVGYPTSFLNLRYLVSDELAHFAQLLRKLMQTKHPLIKMIRKFIMSTENPESKRSLQINGLIVLLISKAAGQPSGKLKSLSSDVSDGIHNSQRCLAEIAEMIYMGTVIHRGILDLKTVEVDELKSMDQGNKLAVLCGDYLLANACNNLAKLHNTEVVDLMSQVISDISEGIFRKKSQHDLLKIWLDNINSNSSSLLANSAKSAMVLVKHSSNLQHAASEFARHLDITHKIWSELMNFKKDLNHTNKKGSLFNAIYLDKYKFESRIEQVPNDFSLNESSNQSSLNEHEFNENIYEDCKKLFENHYSIALENLRSLEISAGNSDRNAVESLEAMLNLMKNTI